MTDNSRESYPLTPTHTYSYIGHELVVLTALAYHTFTQFT